MSWRWFVVAVWAAFLFGFFVAALCCAASKGEQR